MIDSAKKALASWLPRGRFAKSISVLAGGTALSQLLLAAASPVLTRLYTPDQFGLLGVFAGLLALIGVVSSLRYELAIPLPEDDGEAANLVVLCLGLVLLAAIATALIVLTGGGWIAERMGFPELAGVLWLLPIGVFLSGVYCAFSYWSIRTKSFGTIARTKLRQTGATIGVQLLAFKLGGLALLVGQVAGQSAGALSLARPALATGSFKAINWAGIVAAARKFKKFPYFSTWEGLANTAGMQFPPLMLAALFGPAAAGIYTLANRILMLPMSLIGTAVSQVFLSDAAEAHRESRLGALVSAVYEKLTHIAMAPALALMIVGPELFQWIFGPQWRNAGEFARWMMPWIYFVFVASPLSTLFAVTGRLRQGMVFQLVLLFTRIAALLVGARSGDLVFTIMLFAAASALCWLGFLLVVAKISGNSAASLWRPGATALGYGAICVSPLLLAKLLRPESPALLLAAITASALLCALRYGQLLKRWR